MRAQEALSYAAVHRAVSCLLIVFPMYACSEAPADAVTPARAAVAVETVPMGEAPLGAETVRYALGDSAACDLAQVQPPARRSGMSSDALWAHGSD